MAYQVTLLQLIQVAAMPLFILLGVFIAKNRNRLKDLWNIKFNKARTVKVNFITASGRNIERYIVPDARGVMHINGGAYPYHKDSSVLNAEHRIPEVWVIESQPHPATPDIVNVQVAFKNESVPGVLLSFSDVEAQKLAGKTAQEIEQMLNSKIINDIVNASSKQMQKLEMMFYISIGTLGLVLLGNLFLWNAIKNVNTQIQIIKALLAGVGGG